MEYKIDYSIDESTFDDNAKLIAEDKYDFSSVLKKHYDEYMRHCKFYYDLHIKDHIINELTERISKSVTYAGLTFKDLFEFIKSLDHDCYVFRTVKNDDGIDTSIKLSKHNEVCYWIDLVLTIDKEVRFNISRSNDRSPISLTSSYYKGYLNDYQYLTEYEFDESDKILNAFCHLYVDEDDDKFGIYFMYILNLINGIINETKNNSNKLNNTLICNKLVCTDVSDTDSKG